MRDMEIIVIAGRDIKKRIDERRSEVKKNGNLYDSKSLCKLQRENNIQGYCEAEICESIHGFTLRYASGLNNFGIIARARDIGSGSFDEAVAYAKKWQDADPDRRYVTASVEKGFMESARERTM